MREFEWYLPESEAAELLGCHYRKVRELAERRALSFLIMPDHKLKISKESVLRLMELRN
ncbi:hypothetical protein SBDP1_230020 [Syntrophobacter sp. SbD1]|nr:hypothetical protein SBDP1_230020 [Syntrophobacter sp. SbD1]